MRAGEGKRHSGGGVDDCRGFGGRRGERFAGEPGCLDLQAFEALGHREAFAAGIFGFGASEHGVVAGRGEIRLAAVACASGEGRHVIERASDIVLVSLGAFDGEDVKRMAADSACGRNQNRRRVPVLECGCRGSEKIAAGLPGFVVPG